jgi:NAD(P)-dependent dehydrogenase (short-subunit alcohol dehydrogenase family)
MKKLSGKLALITGATRGIGAAVAERYAQEGADLILVGRSYEDLEKMDDRLAAYNVSVTLTPLDLRQFAGIDEMAHKILNRFGKLDVLVGNAAILGLLTPIVQLPADTWHEVWEINFFANWYLLKAFEPLLQRSEAGRGVFVTTSVTKGVHPFWSAYSLSKKALEEMILLHVAENTSSSVKINLIDPGEARTDMHAQAMPGVDPLTLPTPSEITDLFVQLASDQLSESGRKFYA